MDPMTMSMMASGMKSLSQPATSSAGPSSGTQSVGGMQINSGASQWLWPAALGLVAIVWLKGR